MKIKINPLIFITLFLFSCQQKVSYLEQALGLAGYNRVELEKVITHYSYNEADSLKLKAAIFLIENMPGHYSYAGEDISKYYEEAMPVLTSDLPIEAKKEKLAMISARYPHISTKTVQDIEIITADYLIQNIDQAFHLWQHPWAQHLDFGQFCEYLLPYKCFELQQLDQWKDTLSIRFTNRLQALYAVESYDSPLHASLMALQELREYVHPVVETNRRFHPFKSASTIYKLPCGPCNDYVNLAVSTLRSIGLPAVIESLPQWGRHHLGHTWYALWADKGKMMPSAWDLQTNPGNYSFPYERIPKVFRQSYSINRQTEEYFRKSLHKHSTFSVFNQDVTDEYMTTSNLSIPVFDQNISENYVYIALFNGNEWNIVDYGTIEKKCAQFTKMGREVVYIVLGLVDSRLVPISHPFILKREGSPEYLIADTTNTQEVVLRRKYPQNANVANMQHRILNGRIQAADTESFDNPVTLYSIDDLHLPDLIDLNPHRPYRYWRYLSPENSYGSIAELQFFQHSPDKRIAGRIIGTTGLPGWEREKAFDDNWLTSFTASLPDDSWIGMDFGKAVSIRKVRCVPRTDDNCIHFGDTYELKYWDTDNWRSLGVKTANENYLVYEHVPGNALLWLSNLTRGRDERIFIYKDNKQIWW